MKKPRIGCYAVYEPPEEGWEDWENQFAGLNHLLENLGAEIVPAREAVKDQASADRVAEWFFDKDLDTLHALIVSWSFDHYSIQIQHRIGVPLVGRAIPGIRSGSIVGTQQLNSILSDIEIPHRIYYGELEDENTARETMIFARACTIIHRLHGARIGVIGRRTEGMTPTAVDEVEILRLFGTRLLNYGMDEFDEIAGRIDMNEARSVWNRFCAGAVQVTSQAEQGVLSARNYLACRKIVQELKLDALAVGSYPKCQGTMCVPIAWLNEEGLPAGCEGDVNSTLCMLILSMLSEPPVHFGEMLAIDEGDHSIVTSHCGCGSPSLADENGYILHPVRLANHGACIRFCARSGPVTYVNLVGRKGNYRLCAFEGEAIPTTMVFEGNPLRFTHHVPFEKIWSAIAKYGFGHHWMTAYAHVLPVLKDFCRLRGMMGVFPDEEVVPGE